MEFPPFFIRRTMILGYAFIIAAAICWGLSATWARHLITTRQADAVLLSQTRVCFAWLILALGIAACARRRFAVRKSDLPYFAILGLVGIAGANFFLYRAIAEMNAALADLIQFTAPILVVLWMWIRGRESLDNPKLIALGLSTAGCALALGTTGTSVSAPTGAVASAALSAICFATVLILGKELSGRHHILTYLNYSLLAATLFWLIISPPWSLAGQIQSISRLAILVLFSVTSILLPYLFFFSGLKRIPASRASIVSTFEPVVVAIGSWLFLAESLAGSQIVGILLVCTAIVLVELTTQAPKASDLIG